MLLDGVVGEVLFYVLRLCLGPLVYTYDVHRAWVKVYSRMLKVIVPIAISYELKSGSKLQEERFAVRNSNMFGDNQGGGVRSSIVNSAEAVEDAELKSERIRLSAPTLKKN